MSWALRVSFKANGKRTFWPEGTWAAAEGCKHTKVLLERFVIQSWPQVSMLWNPKVIMIYVMGEETGGGRARVTFKILQCQHV